VPQVRVEYDGYIGLIFSRVKTGKLESMVEYMKVVETENMGLSFNKENAIDSAKVMMKWKEYIAESI
jgi:hypothetical protein